MRLARTLPAILVTVLVAAPDLAAGQEPVRDFTLLNTRLRPGDTVWVTDAQGREIKGKIASLSPESLALNAKGAPTFSAAEVGTIRLRERDTLRSGALIGLGVGALIGVGLCAAAEASAASDYAWCAAGFGSIGTGIGVGIDALTPGKKIVAYRAPGAAAPSAARLTIAPVVTPRAKGLAVAFAF